MQNATSTIQQTYINALNNHDLDAVIQCFDKNATVNLPFGLPGKSNVLHGQGEIRQFFEQMIKGFHAEPRDLHVNGDQLQWVSRISSNLLKQLGVDSVESSALATVKNGKFISFNASFPQDVVKKIQAANVPVPQSRPGSVRPSA